MAAVTADAGKMTMAPDPKAQLTTGAWQVGQISYVDEVAKQVYFTGRGRDGFLYYPKLYRVGYEELGDADFSSFASMIRAFPDLIRLGAFSNLWSFTKRFFRDRRVRQAFSLQPLLVGGNPLTTTSIYGLIHAMERRGGIWFSKGGTAELV
ncbi:MAG: hypothetical protein EBV77_12890, partial [Gemmatimonadaceae bacterium]|nr:hypothetical protein [Gemmatimonadaceae bacterium]